MHYCTLYPPWCHEASLLSPNTPNNFTHLHNAIVYGTPVFVRMWKRHSFVGICIICTSEALIRTDKVLLLLWQAAQVTGINIFFPWISPLGKILNWVDQRSYINVSWTGTSVLASSQVHKCNSHVHGFILTVRMTAVCICILSPFITLHMWYLSLNVWQPAVTVVNFLVSSFSCKKNAGQRARRK